jgi:zinc transporter ZupT
VVEAAKTESTQTGSKCCGFPAIPALAWINLIGDGMHNLVDGAVLAAAFLINKDLGIIFLLTVCRELFVTAHSLV